MAVELLFDLPGDERIWLAAMVAITLLLRLGPRLVDRLIDRLIARTRPAPPTPPPPPPPTRPPSWTLTLLIDADEEASLFRPSVQLRGSPVPWRASIRLELVDEVGAVRTSCERWLPAWAVGAQLPLPQLGLPEGVAVDEALRWHWDVVLDDPFGEMARWREHPAPAGALNAEAELELVGVERTPET